MNAYRITLRGQNPLLMHQDNFAWADGLRKWREKPENKKISVAGDDRSPAWTWLGSLYFDSGSKDRLIGLPSDNLMTTLREGGAQVAVPGGRSGKTFKAQSQSGIQVIGLVWPLLPDPVTGRKTLSMDQLDELVGEPDFDVHEQTAKDLGFELFTKRVRVQTSKHIRVRPMFRNWAVSGIVHVIDKTITQQVLEMILTAAGTYKGIGDWRPSSRTPGQYGTFKAEVEPA